MNALSTDAERPPSLLFRPKADRTTLLAGLILAGLTHVALPIGALIVMAIATALGLGKETARPTAPPREIVEARFVKLGRIFDPTQLPNRRVPVLRTAPPQGTAVSKNPQQRIRPDAGAPQRESVEDMIARLSVSAQDFAEAVAPQEEEGSPDGIEEGTETTARAGDLYAGQLYAFFRRGWTIPTVVEADALQTLATLVDVEITTDCKVGRFVVRTSSGNALFDQSVLDRLQALHDSGDTLPEPPAEIASQFLGRTIGLRFKGRDAR